MDIGWIIFFIILGVFVGGSVVFGCICRWCVIPYGAPPRELAVLDHELPPSYSVDYIRQIWARTLPRRDAVVYPSRSASVEDSGEHSPLLDDGSAEPIPQEHVAYEEVQVDPNCVIRRPCNPSGAEPVCGPGERSTKSSTTEEFNSTKASPTEEERTSNSTTEGGKQSVQSSLAGPAKSTNSARSSATGGAKSSNSARTSPTAGYGATGETESLTKQRAASAPPPVNEIV